MKRREFIELSASSVGGLLIYSLSGAPMVLNAQEGKVKVGKVNVDVSQELAKQFSVKSIPMLLFFKDGKVADTVIGVQSKDALTKRLAALA